MSDFIIVSAQPCDNYFAWQIEVQLNRFRELGISDKYHVLVGMLHNRLLEDKLVEWRKLEEKYPEAFFHYYYDQDGNWGRNIDKIGYIPLIRPFLLQSFFAENPHLGKRVFYLDSDVLITKFEPIWEYLLDGKTYVSDTKSYLALQYWDSKWKDAKKDKIEELKNTDVIGQIAEKCGLTREILEENDEGVGGAQYIFKDIDHKFFEEVEKNTLIIKQHLASANTYFFESEDKGYQSWCSDMVAVLWALWKRGIKTFSPTGMDFAWATDSYDKLGKVNIYHHAGMGEGIFDKRAFKYISGQVSPLQEDIMDLKSHDKSKAGYYYIENIINTQTETKINNYAE